MNKTNFTTYISENETISAFVTRLKDASRTCDFENYSQESAIVDSVICKCVSNRLRRRLLREPKLDLKTLLEISFTTESAEQQATEMEKHEEHNINKVLPSKNDHKQYSKFSKTKPQSNSGQDEKKLVHCYGCGSNSHTHGSINCPAKGKTCNYCKKPNHFASVCFKNKPKTEPLNDEQNKNVQQVIRESDSEDDYCFNINQPKTDVLIKLDDTKIPFMIDSGASCNIIDSDTFD